MNERFRFAEDLRSVLPNQESVKSVRDLWFKVLGYEKRVYFVDKGAFNRMVNEGPRDLVGKLEAFKAFPDQSLESIPADRAGVGFTVYVKLKK